VIFPEKKTGSKSHPTKAPVPSGATSKGEAAGEGEMEGKAIEKKKAVIASSVAWKK